MLSSPLKGGFWCDPTNQDSSESDSKHKSTGTSAEGLTESDDGQEITAKELDDSSCRSYRAHFLRTEHFNFCGEDSVLGPLVLSLKYYGQNENSSNHIRIILRLAGGTRHKLLEYNADNEESSPLELAQLLCPELTIETLQPVMCPTAAGLLLNFDE